MIDLNNISICTFKYINNLLQSKCKEDKNVETSIKEFVDKSRSFLCSLVHSTTLTIEEKGKLNSLVKYLDNGEQFCNPPFPYGFEAIVKECQDSNYFYSYVLCFLTLVSNLPSKYQPSWIMDIKERYMEWNMKIDEKPLSDLRTLFIHSIYPNIKQYLLPFGKMKIFLDFDGTLTDKDTCNVGIRGNALFAEDTLDRQSLYNALLESYNSKFEDQFNGALQASTIEEFCERYDRMDYECLQPVIDAGLFKGLQKHKVGITGRLIDLSLNVPYFLKHQDPNSLFVISQSWYHEMIQMCLCNNPFEGNLHILPSHIYSSSLVYDNHSVATGDLNKLCGGCNHKRNIMCQLIDEDCFSVVIGDSLGDLGMLLKAKLPILLHPSNRTKQVLLHFNIATESIMNYQEPLSNTIFIANNWSEIIAVLCQHTMRSDSLQPKDNKIITPPCSYKDCALMSLTNDYYNNAGGDLLKSAIIETIEGGATMIQIRDKTENFDRMIKQANDLKFVVSQYHIPLVINDRVDVAILSDVDGVHIGQNDMKADLCRRLLGPHKIMGLSAQTVEQAVKAEQDGADYIGTGAIFPTISKDDADVVGLDGLQKICSSVSIPVVSIGGVNKDNAKSTIKVGACGIAVISAIFGREDIREATRELRDVIDNALN